MRELIDLPQSMEALPRDVRGFPVPKFVQWFDGAPDFRVVDDRHFRKCIQEKVCWLCGGKLGARMFFVIGPMCGINRISSEPPSHKGCAEFAAKNCPFLTKPLAVRNERDMPTEHDGRPLTDPAGISLARNPGCCILWETGTYEVFRVTGEIAGSQPGYLINMGEPGAGTSFWREGRPATRAEVEDSVVKGLPALMKACESPEQLGVLNMEVGRFSVRVLDRFLPKPRMEMH